MWNDEIDRLVRELRPHLSGRQLRLFGCACARQAWHLLDDRGRAAIATAERFAEGQAALGELQATVAAARPTRGALDASTLLPLAWGDIALEGPSDSALTLLLGAARTVAGALAAEAARSAVPGTDWAAARDSAFN